MLLGFEQPAIKIVSFVPKNQTGNNLYIVIWLQTKFVQK